MDKKVLVYIQEKELAPHGGPVAVCYYYNEEKKKRGDSYFSFLHDLKAHEELHDREKKYLENAPLFVKNIYKDIKTIVKYNKLLGFKYPTPPLDFSQYDVLHFHDTLSLYIRRYELKNFKGKIILQSHSPKPFGQEQIDSIPKRLHKFIPFMNKRFEAMDKFAFERADIIVFPCEYAEEPYYNNWPYYKTIHTEKASCYRYLLTGIPQCVAKRDREAVRNELKISNSDFVISYVGRHNEVKGYGLLKELGKTLLETSDDIWVVCAGKEAPLTRLEHKRWREIGWTTDAHSYISASDIFVLPNKETYFDIVMMEVLSLGKIVVASRTGGNKYFEEKGCKGVFLYDTIEEAQTIINKIKMMSISERHLLEQSNKDFFADNLTVTSMYDNYIRLLQQL